MLDQNRVKNFQSTQKMKFTKTKTEYNIRLLLKTITTMFIIISGLMIVLGISGYSHYHSFSFFLESAKGPPPFFTPSIMSIFLGMVLLVVTSFGFFGSLKQSTCLVNLYALILAIILIVKLVVVILAFTASPGQVMRYIDIPVWGYTTEPEIRDEIDRLQVTLNCCGSSSYQDYMNMDFPANYSTVSINKEVDGQPITITVPSSCCVVAGDYVCIKMRSNSCKNALVNLIVRNSSLLGVFVLSFMLFQLLGVVFALLLARCIRKLKRERAFMSWRINTFAVAKKNSLIYGTKFFTNCNNATGSVVNREISTCNEGVKKIV